MTTTRPPSVSWLQQAVAAGAGVRSHWLRRRLRTPASTQQKAAFGSLLGHLARTRLGMAHGLAPGLTYHDFRATVPLRTYEDFTPWIERSKAGEADVLWPGRCRYFAVSSGTTAGRTKYLPVTDALLAHFRRAGLDSLGLYANRSGGGRVFRGRHLFLGGSTALAPLPSGGWSGDLSGITARNLPRWAERHLYEPGAEVALIDDWPAKIEAIAARTAGRNLTLVAGLPSWLLVFAERLRARTGQATLREVWPRLECIVHGGVPLGPYRDELLRATGPGVALHEVYPASEGFIAAQEAGPEDGLRLLTDAGIFYEFVPLGRYDESQRGRLGREALTVDEVQPDVDYVLVMTTPGGLCRYVIGDVVRFVSTHPPRLVYAGRTRLQLSAFGEHVIEKELTDALTAAGAVLGFGVSNFHVAPRFMDASRDVRRGAHEWWIEAAAGRPLPDAAAVARLLDAELQARNEDYEAKRRGGGMEEPLVRFVAAGTFEAWLRAKGKWGGQNKMPRCRSDRDIADELARLA